MRNILVVDDSRFAQLAFVYALKGTEYAMHTAGSGQQAMEQAARMRFDLVFLDLKDARNGRCRDAPGLAAADRRRAGLTSSRPIGTSS